MKILVATVLAAGSALCQQPDNAAADAAKKRIETIRLSDAPVVVHMAGTKGCSIPLLNALPKNASTGSRMPSVQPSGKPLPGDLVDVPAPACGEVASAQFPATTFHVLPRRSVVLVPNPSPVPAPVPAPKQ